MLLQITIGEQVMVKNNPSNVSAAFEILLEEIEAEIDFINKVGSRAFEERDYDNARDALDRANQITAFRDKVVFLRKEWGTFAEVQNDGEREEIIHAERRNLGRLQRGMRTPETAFYQPILKALVDLGGSSKMGEVQARLETMMKGVLTAVDYEPLASDTEMLRWRNTAQWARYSMVKEGLLKPNSPRGVWEITEAGRKALTKETR
jgi:restriction system protein